MFFPLITLSKNTVVLSEVYYKYRVGRPGSITLKPPNSQHANDFLNRIKFYMEFMELNYDLIKTDISAWQYRLIRKGLNYVSMCLKTKTSISWSTVFILFYKSKSISFLFKLIWRFIIHFLKKK